jgi:Protein of unknown function (DUF3078)
LKRLISFLFCLNLFFIPGLFAQQDTVILYKWIPKAVAGLNISQLALSNWSQGGDNSITWTIVGTGGIKYATEEWGFTNDLKIAYGRTKLGSDDFKTNDNELYLESVLSRNVGWDICPYFSNTLRTALTAGYDYDVSPKAEIANFFDPGYLTQSLGFIYNKVPGFETRLGFAVQEIITNKFTQYSDDASTPEIEKVKIETGLESVSTAEYTVMENVLLKTKLRLFTQYKSLDVWDVRWDNTIAAKVNDYLNVNFTFLLVYEKAQIERTQIKEGLQLGLVYSIL